MVESRCDTRRRRTDSTEDLLQLYVDVGALYTSGDRIVGFVEHLGSRAKGLSPPFAFQTVAFLIRPY